MRKFLLGRFSAFILCCWYSCLSILQGLMFHLRWIFLPLTFDGSFWLEASSWDVPICLIIQLLSLLLIVVYLSHVWLGLPLALVRRTLPLLGLLLALFGALPLHIPALLLFFLHRPLFTAVEYSEVPAPGEVCLFFDSKGCASAYIYHAYKCAHIISVIPTTSLCNGDRSCLVCFQNFCRSDPSALLA
ncbi:uncharacterized protein LOC124692515 isoform X2 [Lolium rigidum]|uniref:uncharacterized protein LOC124692515 isoform X2 n=1 Tax=Lolium rigidum TaxID=89674 RepID=UPI001F5CA04D|nr:uncharacterized protein LOC124692515 isoform X2 [Lolium rigidum]